MLILGGDFNVAFSKVTGKLLFFGKQLGFSFRKLSMDFSRVIRKFVLFDLWRIEHPMERTYSFFLPPWLTFPYTVDYFFGTIPALRRMLDADIGPITR